MLNQDSTLSLDPKSSLHCKGTTRIVVDVPETFSEPIVEEVGEQEIGTNKIPGGGDVQRIQKSGRNQQSGILPSLSSQKSTTLNNSVAKFKLQKSISKRNVKANGISMHSPTHQMRNNMTASKNKELLFGSTLLYPVMATP